MLLWRTRHEHRSQLACLSRQRGGRRASTHESTLCTIIPSLRSFKSVSKVIGFIAQSNLEGEVEILQVLFCRAPSHCRFFTSSRIKKNDDDERLHDINRPSTVTKSPSGHSL